MASEMNADRMFVLGVFSALISGASAMTWGPSASVITALISLGCFLDAAAQSIVAEMRRGKP